MNFYKCHGITPNGAWVVGTEAGGREGRREGRFSAEASNQISLMKWIYGIQPDEPEATDILSCAS